MDLENGTRMCNGLFQMSEETASKAERTVEVALVEAAGGDSGTAEKRLMCLSQHSVVAPSMMLSSRPTG